MTDYSIWMIECGNATFTADQAFGGFYRSGEPLVVPMSAIIIRGEGRVILFDTGVDPSLPETAAILKDRKYDPCFSVEFALQKLGLTAEDVTDVILSHTHWDHIGGVGLFRRARFYLQKREFFKGIEFLAVEEKFSILARCFSADHFISLLEAAKEHRLVLLDGPCDDLFPGIHIRTAEPGHTECAQMAIVETPGKSFVAVGDVALRAENIEGINGRYLPMTFKTSSGTPEGMLRAMDWLNRFCEGDVSRTLIGHDSESWSRYPGKMDEYGLHFAEVHLAQGQASML